MLTCLHTALLLPAQRADRRAAVGRHEPSPTSALPSRLLYDGFTPPSPRERSMDVHLFSARQKETSATKRSHKRRSTATCSTYCHWALSVCANCTRRRATAVCALRESEDSSQGKWTDMKGQHARPHKQCFRGQVL